MVADFVEGFGFDGVVDYDDGVCVFVVLVDYASEPLLAGSVPDAEFDEAALAVE